MILYNVIIRRGFLPTCVLLLLLLLLILLPRLLLLILLFLVHVILLVVLRVLVVVLVPVLIPILVLVLGGGGVGLLLLLLMPVWVRQDFSRNSCQCRTRRSRILASKSGSSHAPCRHAHIQVYYIPGSTTRDWCSSLEKAIHAMTQIIRLEKGRLYGEIATRSAALA